MTLILIVVLDISWSEFVLVQFQGLHVLILSVALDIPGPRYEIVFSIPAFKLVVASFVKCVVIFWAVNIQLGKSIKKPPGISRLLFSIRSTSNLIIDKDDLRTELETFIFRLVEQVDY